MSSTQTPQAPLPDLAAVRRALIEARLRPQARASALVRRAHAADVPLSFAQERLYFLDRLQRGTAAYNVHTALRLPGALDAAALGRALGEVVRRHEVLRTAFRESGGVPVQAVAPFTGFALPVVDLSGLGAAEREAEVARRATADAAEPFDLAAGTPIRAVLLRLGVDGHVLLLCMHHIVSDGWSMQVLSHEVKALYAAYSQGGASPLPELPLQYADYAVWQREQARSGRMAGPLEYWKRQLAGAPELLELPTDRPRPPAPSFRGATVPVAFPPGLPAALRELARREEATLFMVVLGAFQALLSRYSGSVDVLVGAPIAGRSHVALEGLVGCFVNTLVLRTDLSGDAPFRQLLRRVRGTVLEAYENQEVPFETLVAELRPDRSASHSPVIQVMLAMYTADAPAAAPSAPGPGGVAVEHTTAKFDLTLELREGAGGLRGWLEYSTDLFERGTMERFAGHLVATLEQVAADARVRLSGLGLMGPAERARVVEEWNRTRAPYPADRCIHALFEAQVERTPDAVALVYGEAALTYRALNRRANGLAHHLAGLGVGPETRVGICLERGVEMVVSLLAVLKAGGAYVPLDPAHPAERLSFMLADAGVAVLLTQGSLRAMLPVPDGVPVLDMEEARAWPDAGRTDVPVCGVSPANAAYVLYTSGSTGRPKGVVVAHGSVVNRLCWMQAEYGLTADDVVLQKTPFSFDVSVWEFFWPLQQGATLVMARPDGHRDPSYLADEIQRRGVTTLHFVPSMLQHFVETVEADRCASLTRVFCSGEALAPGLVERFHARFPAPVALHNLYGPTEAAVDVSYWPCARGDAAGIVPIGRPVWNTRLYVVDGALQPVPVGVPGELCIAGVQVARGYLGRPALTAERFVPDPLSAEGGGRMYRTGDRARWRPDGTLEYLGRLDEQVKIRGFRIELGEIDAVLRRAAGVADCAVVVRRDGEGEPRLVAYVVAAVDAEVDVDALRAHLRRGLPDYMVPAAFVPVERLPLTPNGKLDRRALPAPEGAPGAAYVAPRTPAEKLLAETWAEVLRVERVGIHDGFFDLGGHSLLAIRMITRVGDVFGVELPLRIVFDHPTVAALAPEVEAAAGRAVLTPPITAAERAAALLARLDRMPDAEVHRRLHAASPAEAAGAVEDSAAAESPAAESVAVQSPAVESVAVESPTVESATVESSTVESGVVESAAVESPAERRGRLAALLHAAAARGDDFPLSFAQQRVWVAHQLDPRSAAYNMPYALRVLGGLDVEVLERALTGLAGRHETLRTVFPAEGGVPVQRVLPPGPVVPRVTDLRHLDPRERADEAGRLARDEAARPFDLATGPLLRVHVLRMDDAEDVVLFTLHHVVSDGWSQDVLVRDLSELYTADAESRAPALPRLPVQYADYAVWQRNWLAGPVLEAQLDHWREALRGAPPVLDLPTDRPRAPVPGDAAESRSWVLSPELSGALRALSRREGATLFMTLLAAFQALLARWSGADDVVVGTPVAGRTRLEVENLVGFFVNLLALRGRLEGDPSFRALVARARDETLRAHAHQDLPFEQLVDALQPERSPAVTPLFQVLFALRMPAGESLRLGGLRAAPAAGGNPPAKYDLSLEMADDGERLSGGLLYRTSLFDPATAARLMDHLARVLEQVAADPDLPLSRLSLLDTAERDLVVQAWNRTAAPYPADRCIHQLFEAQAARTPNAPAVLYGEDALTYAELDARANRLARHLVRRGVGPEVRVGLCLERGLELMACILGVMKAGGAYVPVDPSHPAERIGYVFGDAGVSVVLTQERLADRLSLDADVPVLAVDAMADALDAEPADAPRTGVTSENLAYVIYTSGSTGRPKGVAMHHRGVANYVDWGGRFYGADAGNGAPVFSSMAVDLTITNLLPLFAGLPVRFLPEENPVEALAEVLRGAPDFGLIKITPVHLSLLTPMLTAEEARRAARTLVIGADFLPAEPTVWWQENAPEVRLMNEYGPTETVVGCSAYVLPNGLHRHGPVPVGGAIQNLTFFVLDARMEPVPVGLPGELYIGGAGVARGYLGRPGLSAEKFVPDPFAGGGARMYRTGDRARWLEGGNLLILGRTDHQVKIRGYRVELGEIEAVLRRHPAVSGCLVVVREDRPGDRRLVAYVVADADDAALRQHLRTSLPEYMVPAAFVRLETLPKTATGKVDPKTLPAPEYGAGQAGYMAPRTPVEATLAKVWAAVLGVERVGVDDVFFELGGDSILAIQAASRARWDGVEVTPRQVLEHRTVAGVAAALERGEGGGARAAEQGRVTGPVALTPIQGAFFSREHPAVAHHNLSVVMAVDAAVTDAVLQTALRAVLEHHDVLRLRYRRTEAGWEQWHADEHGITLERADLSGLAPGEREPAQEAVAERWQASLDLEHGPLGRAVLFDRGEEGRVLLLLLHHLLVDGVSWRILREDLDRACAQAGRGLGVDLGSRSTSYRGWARALQAYAAGDALSQAEYWLAQGAKGVPSLPYEGEGPPDVGSTRSVATLLDAEETRILLQDVPAAYGTQINDVLLCAVADALGAWTGGTRTRVALESHGRAEEVGAGVDLTRSVGWFTSIYPVVLDTAGAAGPAERLARIQAQLAAVPALGVGYGALRWLGPEGELRRALAAQPEPEVVFNYLGQFDQGIAPGLAIRFAGGPRGHDVADANHRVYPLAVSGTVIGGRLGLYWRYGEGTHRAETIQRVADACLRSLRALIAHAAAGARR